MTFNEMYVQAYFAENNVPPTIEGLFAFAGGLTISPNSLKTWWPGTELNRRRQPFQGCALPPELPGHVSRAAGGGLLQLSASARLAGGTTEAQRNAHGTLSIIAITSISLNVDGTLEKARQSLARLIMGLPSVHSRKLLNRSYAKLFTNSTRLRSAMPDGPLAIQGFCSSIQAVPAMSR